MEKTFEYVYENDDEFMCPLISRLRGEILSYKGECITTYQASKMKEKDRSAGRPECKKHYPKRQN